MSGANSEKHDKVSRSEIIVDFGSRLVKVLEDGTVFRQLRNGEWRQLKSGLMFTQARRKAENVRAIVTRAVAPEARRNENQGK